MPILVLQSQVMASVLLWAVMSLLLMVISIEQSGMDRFTSWLVPDHVNMVKANTFHS